MFAVVVDHDGELDGLEQRPKVRFWRLREVCREVGQRVDQGQLVDCYPLRGRLFRFLQFCEFGAQLLLVLGQVVVAAAKCCGEGIVRVALLCLLEDRGLLLGDLGKPSSYSFSFSVVFDGCLVVDAGEVGFEDGTPVGAEDAVGEELRDCVEQGVLTEVEGFLV
ncbi:hypothetical protein [Amycolatopsis sp. lyj-90]|uniref:hypothetical protein n=1 Tax=Amycolatopsis sp. lyj-90 TaxID=2789285 RepID=UPI00397B5AB2